jgi:NAD(P)-dependent dehydrogenase (short-subunit alcohol dehydrogenase family)
MDLGLDGRVAVVTGASRGIGLAVVRALAAEGVRVVAGARSAPVDVDDLLGTGQVRFLQVDLADPAAPARLVESAGDQVDILVNNVGIAPARTAGFLSVTDQDWQDTLTLDLLAAVRATRAALPLMLAAGRGAIVNVSSVNAKLADPTVIDYSAAKAALTNWSLSASKEFGRRGIRFVTVHPGPVATDLWLGERGVAATIGEATGTNPEAIREEAMAGIATRRFSTPEEVATIVALLASLLTANVTGSNYVIDGGLLKTM